MLMSCLSLTYLERLVVGPECQLRSGLKSALPSSSVKVDDVEIGVSLSVNKLASLISHMEVDKLSFRAGCRVLGMDVITTPPPKVSLSKLVSNHSSIFLAALSHLLSSVKHRLWCNKTVLSASEQRCHHIICVPKIKYFQYLRK